MTTPLCKKGLEAAYRNLFCGIQHKSITSIKLNDSDYAGYKIFLSVETINSLRFLIVTLDSDAPSDFTPLTPMLIWSKSVKPSFFSLTKCNLLRALRIVSF